MTEQNRTDPYEPDVAGRDILPRGEAAPDTAAGLGAIVTGYTFIGVEGTLDTTRADREEGAKKGISSHPIGWGVAFYKRAEYRADI